MLKVKIPPSTHIPGIITSHLYFSYPEAAAKALQAGLNKGKKGKKAKKGKAASAKSA